MTGNTLAIIILIIVMSLATSFFSYQNGYDAGYIKGLKENVGVQTDD